MELSPLRFDAWPFEQRCLEELLAAAPRAAERARVARAPMQLFNSPWGEFARHIWGGHGKEMRRHAYDDALRTHGVWDEPALRARVSRVAERHLSAFVC